jgi:phosphoenolpyruvate carboxylase
MPTPNDFETDALLARAVQGGPLGRGRDLAAPLHELCRSAGDEPQAPDRDEAARRIGAMSPEDLGEVLRFVTARFHLLNTAEQVNIIRVNRRRAAAAKPDAPRPESLAEALLRLKQAGMDAAGVRALVQRLDVQPTLTAHPTEAKRRGVPDNLVKAAHLLDAALDEHRSDDDRGTLRLRLDGLVQVLLATDDVRPQRLEVADEVKNGLFFLRSSIWSAAPRLMRDLSKAADTVFGPGSMPVTGLPALLRYRTWIGGDRDGNPRVTHDVTDDALHQLRAAAIDLWDKELLELQRELTVSRRLVPIPEWFLDLVREEGDRFIDDAATIEKRRNEPIRVRLLQIRGHVRRDAAYDGASLLRDLLRVRDALSGAGLEAVANTGRLADAIVRARIFGLHLATLDIRQHSRVHETVIAELLRLAGVCADYAALTEEQRLPILRAELANPRPLRPLDAPLSPAAAELMQTLAVVRRAVQADRRAVRSYIISMTHGVSDMLEAVLLMKEAGLTRIEHAPDGSARLVGTLHVVPLLETIDDLTRGESLVAATLDDPLYRSHLDSLVPPELSPGGIAGAPVQEIMLGYSDSNKDGGFFMANLSLDHAQRRIAHAVRSRGVLLRYFHGRGGTIGRGGGRAGRAILATPPPARTGRIRFTEQGEVISFRYALPAIAERHLEQILNAALLASADDREADHDPRLPELLERMARRSMEHYRTLIDDPEFWGWFVGAGPITAIAGLPIASRPVMRAAGAALADRRSGFEELRAIPWVFSWVQMRCLAPGWFGRPSSPPPTRNRNCWRASTAAAPGSPPSSTTPRASSSAHASPWCAAMPCRCTHRRASGFSACSGTNTTWPSAPCSA